MGFIAGLLIFIALVIIPVVMVIILINPFKIPYPLKGEVTRGKWLVLLLGSMLGLLFFGGVFGMIANDQKQHTPQQKAQEMVKQSGIEDDGSVKASVKPDGAIVIEPVEQKYPVIDIDDPIAKVDIYDDQAIVKSAGVPVVRTSDSSDTEGEPKKIYIFNHKYVGSQVELSRTQIVIGWTIANDSDLVKKMSPENVKVVQRLARATLGLNGGKAIDDAMQGKGLKDGMIDGHKVWVTPCVDTTSCMMKIYR